MSVREAFEARVSRSNDGCWLWIGDENKWWLWDISI